MANTAVNPTRMELTRLKNKLKTARRGHKLLKDKRDELMRQFLDMVRELRALRGRVEAALLEVHGSFTVASALMGGAALETALLCPRRRTELELSSQNVMSVRVPAYRLQTLRLGEEPLPYGLAATSGELDDALAALEGVLPDLVRLAQMEKGAQLLSQEIEKTRRRVNALEYVMIPQMEETIQYIAMKLEENERSNTVRLMKVKDMLLQEALEERRAQDAAALQAWKG